MGNSLYLGVSQDKAPSCSKQVGRRETLKGGILSFTYSRPPVMEAEVAVAVEVHRIEPFFA